MMERMKTKEEMQSTPKYTLGELQVWVEQRIFNLTGVQRPISFQEVPSGIKGDYGIQLSSFAKESQWNLKDLAEAISEGLKQAKNPFIKEVHTAGPYLNFELDMPTFGAKVTQQVLEMGPRYGEENIGNNTVVVIDMSSPNIAKRMSYGHLRSTIIGDALTRIYRATGYEVLRDNHIGDWGTQFGNLIVAIKRWGNEEELLSSKDPIGVLQDLYVRFHSEMEKEKASERERLKEIVEKEGMEAVPDLQKAVEDVSQEIMARKRISREQLDMFKVVEDALDRVVTSTLEEEGREWFKKLEEGDPEARRFWKICVDLSMKEFERIYRILGVEFEYTLGESFYEGMLVDTIQEVRQSGKATVSDGALVIDMTDKKLGVAIVQKSDGASVYMTRDLATAKYREKDLSAGEVIYVVGEDQKLYFQQLFEILRRLGHPVGERSKHVYFGMVTLPEGRMSTRKGRVILLKDVIDEGLKRVRKILKTKNPDVYSNRKLREIITRQITVGALKWNDLAYDPKRPIIFDWDRALNLEGYSAPFVQYAAVRANSILRTAGVKTGDLKIDISIANSNIYREPAERDIVKKLAAYPKIILEALKTSNPSQIATYAYELAKLFNSFYTSVPVLAAKNDEIRTSRLNLVAATSQTIFNALNLLGIEIPEKM